jgi:hypothetical protein
VMLGIGWWHAVGSVVPSITTRFTCQVHWLPELLYAPYILPGTFWPIPPQGRVMRFAATAAVRLDIASCAMALVRLLYTCPVLQCSLLSHASCMHDCFGCFGVSADM